MGNGRRFSGISINSGLADAKGKEFGTGHEALKDKKVRQAIRAGIDIDTLREQVMQDYAQPATSFVPSVYEKWALPEDNPVVTGFDVERAKKLLDDAGWKAGSDGIREKDGEKLSLRFLADADATIEQNTAKFLKPWMKDIGIELKNEASDADTTSELTTKGDYDMYYSGWSLGPDPDYQLFINTCASRPDAEGNGGTSQDGYCNKKFDKLYQQQHVELDEDKRADLVHQALALHYDDAASVTLWYQNQLEAFRSDRFTGFTRTAHRRRHDRQPGRLLGLHLGRTRRCRGCLRRRWRHRSQRLDRHRGRGHRGHRRRRLPAQPPQEVRRSRIELTPGLIVGERRDRDARRR